MKEILRAQVVSIKELVAAFNNIDPEAKKLFVELVKPTAFFLGSLVVIIALGLLIS